MLKMDSDYQILTKLPADKVIEETAEHFYNLALEDVRKEVERRWKEFADKNVKCGGGKYDFEIETLLSINTFINNLTK